MSRTVSPSRSRPYGLARVCRVWRAARASVYRHLSSSRPEPPRRPGPVGPMPDAALVEAIRAVLTASPFHGEGHRKVWARLRVAGVRTSKRRVLRLMRASNLLAPSRVGAPRGPRTHDGTIIPEAADTMWGTDLTTTITGEGQVAVFVAVDHYSAECVGIHAARRATRFEALEPIRQACGAALAALLKGSGAVWPCGTITGASTCPTPSSRSLPFWASQARPPSCGRLREMAAPSASSAPSRRTCSGCGPSTPSRSFGRRCSTFGRATTPPGSSNGTGSRHPRPCDRTSFQPRHGPRSINPVSHRPGALHTRPRATPLLKISLAPQGASTHVAKFWRLPRVEPAGAICASEPEVADDPERPCREAEAPIQG